MGFMGLYSTAGSKPLKVLIRLLLMALLFSLIMWLIGSIADYYIFHKDKATFVELLITNIPHHDLYFRLMLIFVIFVFCIGIFFLLKEKITLLEKNAFLLLAVKSTNDAVITKTIDGIITSWNPAAEEIFGFPADDTIGKNINLLIPEGIPDDSQVITEKLLRNEEVKNYETIRRHKNGSLINISISSSLLLSDKKEVIGITSIWRDITHLKKREESEKYYFTLLSAIYESTSDGILVVDKDRKIVSFNRSFCSIWFFDPAELENKRDTEALGSALQRVSNPDQFLHKINRFYEDTNMRGYDEIQLKDGRILERFSAPLYGEDNHYFGRLWQYRDVTRRRTDEAKIIDSQTRFHELFNNMTNGAIVYSPIDDYSDFVIIDINVAAERISQYTKTEILGGNLLKFFPYVKKMGLFDILVQVHKTGQPQTLATETYADDRLDLKVFNSVYKLPSGEVVAVFEDQTEKAKAEKALSESEETYRTMFDRNSAVKLFLAADENEGSIVNVNKAAIQFYGYSEDELLSMHYSELSLTDPEQIAQIFMLALEEKQNRFIAKHKDKNGTIYDVDVYIGGMSIKGKQFLLLNVHNITKQKEAEREIIRLNQELEQRIEERTNELQTANTELRDFAYVVSHDLKAPLRGISQLSSWLKTDYAEKIDDNGKEQLDLIINRAKRMDNLINGILQYSRIGRIKGTPTELNIYDLLQEVIDSINAPDPVKFKLLGNFPVIYADRTRIVQIFQNLLSNTVKYMDKPDGNVTVSAEELDDYWLFRVKDTGPGIEEKYFEKIFQIFQTLESRDKRESTGIGLTLVKKIVQLYGGTISVESTVGEGSTFIFTLSKKEVRNEKQ